ncbi:hypothetical protein [Aequorivita capsosiphonis]|uniref:hypothetical protein n=1 Tax=Aequorivita capsosiphonis TaxID=487317 RepID=UPI000479036F|nr:hypothetical protein [Aequorivita capsosiphonis]
MKILKTSLVALSFMAILSCNDTNKKDAYGNIYDTETADDAFDKTDNNRNATNAEETFNKQNDNSNNGMDSQNMKAMYQDLNMTQEQIERFKRNYAQKLSEMKYGETDEIDAAMKEKLRDESLMDILSKEQNDNYQQWKNNH